MGCFYISPHPSQTLFLPSICFLPANLEHLIFMEGSVKAAHRPTPVSVLLHMVSPLARLRTLDLRGNAFAAPDLAAQFADALHLLPRLTCLNLDGTELMSCNGGTAHLASLGYLPYLRELSLSGCLLGPEGGAALAPVLRLLDLGLLDLSDCFSPGDFLFATPNNIPGDPNPRQVTRRDPAFRWWSELTTAIGGIRGLRSFNFSWNGIGFVKPPRSP